MIDKRIQIRNIYYMLAYSFRVLEKDNYKYMSEEDFDNADDLLAEMLFIAISFQLKQGLKRDYVEKETEAFALKGKVKALETYKNICKKKLAIVCEYDIFLENILLNKIIKSTIFKISKLETIKKERKDKLKSLLPYFFNVDYIEFNDIKWNSVEFDRNNQNYILLLNLCKMISDNTIMSEKEGNKKHIVFNDKQLNLVFQNFVLNYYKEFVKKKNISNCSVNASKIERAIDFQAYNEGTLFLPNLQTDITIEYNNKVLIIDTKYYEKELCEHYGKLTYRSVNINQIHEYVHQYSHINKEKTVTGMLLYAKTDEEIQPDMTDFEMGHRYYIKSLDLNVEPFSSLANQLDNMFEEVFIKQ